ncbi:MAG: Cof-type HAD-IIB family hydrolase [Bacillota bacterium]|nr:Cof-type HAD-IIB family hydrolase [Bacillota bacterium]
MDKTEHGRPDQDRQLHLQTTQQTYKLVACDIDGTLLDLSGIISSENRDAISALARHGIGFTLVTGRMDRMTRPYVRQLDIRLPVIACNGAIIRDCSTDAILFRSCIRSEDVRTIVTWLQRQGYDHLCYTADSVYYPADSQRIRRFHAFNIVLEQEGEKTINLIELTPHALTDIIDFIKILAVLPDLQAIDAAHRMLRQETGCFGELSATTAMDIMANGVNKGTALSRLADLLQVDLAQTVAIGNHDNDVTMLEIAGLGIAMADASPAALAAARCISTEHVRSGVARAIKQFVLSGGTS